MFKKILVNLISLFCILNIISCGVTRNLANGKLSKNENYRINVYYSGCCGCVANYFMIYKRLKKVEQVIYSYNCPTGGNPTKFIFNNNIFGKIISCDKYIATTDSDFTIELTTYEKKIFSLIENNNNLQPEGKIVYFKDIKGFRKPKSTDITHHFPFIKRHWKVKIN